MGRLIYMPRPQNEVETIVAWYVSSLLEKTMADSHLTQLKVASMTGVAQGTISNLLSKGEGAGIATLFKLAPLLHKTAGQLMDEAQPWWSVDGQDFARTKMQELTNKKVG